MFAQSSLTAISIPSASAIRQRSYSQESPTFPNESFMDIDSGYCSLDELEVLFTEHGDDEDDIEILLDPSELDLEDQFVYEMCNISIF
ncbi:hypothetical protein J3Q64DRAFT_1838735 [Phycomyces blakesleeanus]|uniref:Uncharacterized protein n=2 Tax=Phycomyces blakesleeanus TaxID=4837 RepID=A0A162TIX2_PHYB8|nr:hypothetical protein PHYBLDRAFT_149954 [Phycomyces blakesleeanus NRRL 1555(-)]OAD68952.1 hypothetical protein PHYBLDRAFT_149954 [Phycomyces blakesleeanus NRRL 1555(-)]|eukprot:XP_018286992.1 hypothetical protein PHYBLDRAFT_149954 [Phycomyces blakesleeanus NRRL 1555(-)]